jgi:hypothetical protein
MTDITPYTQIRIARPTDQLEKLVTFYSIGLGLSQIGGFRDHDGHSGVILGVPDQTYHLEFTHHKSGSPCPAPTKDNLLVFYFPDIDTRNFIAERLRKMRYDEVVAENPYWKANGITIEDPDGWRIVLTGTPGLSQKCDNDCVYTIFKRKF